VSAGAENFNQEYEPSIDIEPCDCPPEPLHMRMRIVEIFEREVAATLHPKCTEQEAKNRLRLSSEYQELLQSMGVDRRITGLTGVECRKILDQPKKYCAIVQDIHPHHKRMVLSLGMFAELDDMLGYFADEHVAAAVGEAALRFAQEFMDWCPRARRSIYLHILGCHAYRWHRLNDTSSHALELINANVKQLKHFTLRDPKTLDSSTRKDASGSLVSMVKLSNARSLLAPSSPVKDSSPRGPVSCTACGQVGHIRSNRACPKRADDLPQSALRRVVRAYLARKKLRDRAAAADQQRALFSAPKTNQ
jgi:hypothetical protein